MNSILTVSQLNRYMAFKIKEDVKLRGILLRGEISGFTNHAKTGHFYFTLKDRESAVKAVMFNSFASRVRFMPSNGMSVIVMGSVQVFERDGQYQVYVTDIQPDGIGAQYLALEQLKERLASEGVFDERFKKPLPGFPHKIGIVTAKGGAALKDILNILSRRYPLCEAVIFPCVVQGEYAAGSICEALEYADSCGCDLIICGRGGGSPEDLAAFNSEAVARRIFAMNTPVISAVGHETDTTIADLAADLRAPTPSAAAELAVPEITALYDIIDARKNALDAAFTGYISGLRHKLLSLENELKDNYPSEALARIRSRIVSCEERLRAAIKIYFEKKNAEIAGKAGELDALSPLKIMSRGYSLVYSGDKLIKSSSEISAGEKISVRFADGSVEAVVQCGKEGN